MQFIQKEFPHVDLINGNLSQISKAKQQIVCGNAPWQSLREMRKGENQPFPEAAGRALKTDQDKLLQILHMTGIQTRGVQTEEGKQVQTWVSFSKNIQDIELTPFHKSMARISVFKACEKSISLKSIPSFLNRVAYTLRKNG